MRISVNNDICLCLEVDFEKVHIKIIENNTGKVLNDYVKKGKNTIVRAIFTADVINKLKPFKIDMPISSGEIFKHTLDEILDKKGISIDKDGICKYSKKKERYNTWI